MKRMNRSLWKDSTARIPFSLFGIFLLLGSSLTTVFLYDQGMQQRNNQIVSFDYQQVEQLVSEVESDISSLINHISLEKLYDIGLHPVILPSDASRSAEEINIDRLKQALVTDLDLYLKDRYQANVYNDGPNAVNVWLPDTIVSSDTFDLIKVETIDMALHRPLNLPLVSPPNEKSFSTYYTLHVPVHIQIVDLDTNKQLATMSRTISSIITCRYQLLYNLLNEYNETINGLGPFWGLTTLLSNLYSLARGYKHYQTGKPINVVDNHHLEPIINTGLLLENSFVFGAVDPLALIDLASSIKQAIYNKEPSSAIDSFNNISGSSFSIPLNDLSKVSANIDADAPIDTELDQNPQVNLSAIAVQPLYTTESLTLFFQRDSSELLVEIEIQDDKNQIEQAIMDYTSQGYIFTGFGDATTKKNQSTDQMIDDIITQIYSTQLHLSVGRDDDPLISFGDHDGFPIDNGTGPWEIIDTSKTSTVEKPDKGGIEPGCILFGETYDITWSRGHQWSRKIIETVENETITRWEQISTSDTKKEYDVLFAVILDTYSPYQQLDTDILDVFYYNITVQDPNLLDAIDRYKQMIYYTKFDTFISYDTGSYYITSINANIPSWVKQQSWDALLAIYDQISLIKQDESINASTYPNPVTLLQKTADDLITKYHENMSSYLAYDSYQSNGLFLSCGLKAEYCVRSWYVSHVEQTIRSVLNDVTNGIDDALSTALNEQTGADPNKYQTVMDSDTGSLFESFLTIPFGLELNLTSSNSYGQPWDESIRIAVKHFPSYLSAFEETEYEGKKEYFLGIQNICLLGPTGLPVLPLTPVTPWVVTLNLWSISIKGSYATFQVSDCMDETVFHPLFGHQPISVLRKDQMIYDSTGVIVGKNSRISFEMDTIAASLVPAYGLLVGDMDGNLIEQNGRTYE
jgi:hypothetical protein